MLVFVARETVVAVVFVAIETCIAGEGHAGSCSGGIFDVEMIMLENTHHCCIGKPCIMGHEQVLETRRHL